MLNIVNEYTVSDKITNNILKQNGFIKSSDLDCYYKILPLVDDIELFLKIYFDDYNNFFLKENSIDVIDDNYGQPYYPFYEDKSFKYLENVIKKYNQVMDELVNENILKRDVKVKKKSI